MKVRVVLTYHSIDPSGSPISVHPEIFRRQVCWLGEHAARVVPLRSILDPGHEGAIALTFDDGFRNFDEIALPLLREFKLPATLFVVSGAVGKTNAWPGSPRERGIPTLPLLDWPAIGRAASYGIEIGAHSRTHPPLSRLAASDLNREVAGSRNDITQALGIRPLAFCYPYGDVDARAERAAAASYQMAVTTELRAVEAAVDSPRLIPRIDMYYFREPDQLETLGTAAFSRRLMFRRAGRGLRRIIARGRRVGR